ncbi:hypothetical protein HPB50_007222 [Hyalomma asiaticum]|uniref:Uncharacterized protein n=1 Tax=Hyalomma asiaticum TaxID=266040 RepID=A0ACB7S500_HYAAI|nr:hypothetical protein HPB50_007222 [Hyalomma asiaticum]
MQPTSQLCCPSGLFARLIEAETQWRCSRVISVPRPDEVCRKSHSPSTTATGSHVRISIRHCVPRIPSVSFMCAARGMFPKPELKLFLIKRGLRRPLGDAGVRTFTRATAEGLYEVVLHADMAESQLSSLADLFECVLEIPYSNYAQTRRIRLAQDRPTELALSRPRCRRVTSCKRSSLGRKISGDRTFLVSRCPAVPQVVQQPSYDRWSLVPSGTAGRGRLVRWLRRALIGRCRRAGHPGCLPCVPLC